MSKIRIRLVIKIWPHFIGLQDRDVSKLVSFSCKISPRSKPVSNFSSVISANGIVTQLLNFQHTLHQIMKGKRQGAWLPMIMQYTKVDTVLLKFSESIWKYQILTQWLVKDFSIWNIMKKGIPKNPNLAKNSNFSSCHEWFFQKLFENNKTEKLPFGKYENVCRSTKTWPRS